MSSPSRQRRREGVSLASSHVQFAGQAAQQRQPYRDERTESCRHKCLRCLCNATHVVDGSIGIVLLVYGSLIYVRLQPGSHLPTYLLFFGCLLVATVPLAISGIRFAACRRVGLYVAACMSALISVLYIFTGCAFLFGQGRWTVFAERHLDQLYLTESGLDGLKSSAPAMFVAGLVLSLVELGRFWMLLRIRTDLLLADDDPRSGGIGSSRTGMSEPLLPGEGGGGSLTGTDWSGERRASAPGDANGGAAADGGGSSDDDDFLPIDEESLHSDPLWWAKSKKTESGDLSWAKEPME